MAKRFEFVAVFSDDDAFYDMVRRMDSANLPDKCPCDRSYFELGVRKLRVIVSEVSDEHLQEPF